MHVQYETLAIRNQMALRIMHLGSNGICSYLDVIFEQMLSSEVVQLEVTVVMFNKANTEGSTPTQHLEFPNRGPNPR